MTKKIFVSRKIPEIGISMLKEKGYEVDVYMKDIVPDQKELMHYLRKKPYDAVLSLLTDKIDATVFDASPSTKIFANYATGFDNIDVEEAKKRGIVATNTPGAFSDCIAEHAIALIFALTTRLVEADAYVRKGKYKGWTPMNFIGTDVCGKTLGLIGAGNIGSRVAQHISKGFGAKVMYYDVKRNEKFELETGAVFKSTIEEVLRESDFVSLHVPLLESTHHLINAERLTLMKPTSYLINTSRGPVVDEAALVEALKKGTIRGAGLDVFEFEPKLAKGLTKLPNVVLTPHIASARESARNEMARLAAQNIIDFFEGKIPLNIIK